MPPSDLCHWSGEAAPPITRAELGVMPPPVAANGVIFVGYAVPGVGPYQTQTAIAALRESDGALLWRVLDSNYTDHLAFADGILILIGHGLVGLRARDGASLWSTLPWRAYGVLPFAIGGGVLYVIHDAVYAFRVTDGRLLWQTPESDYQDLSAPVVVGATVYVGSSNGFLMALQADTGALLWRSVPFYPTPPTLPMPHVPATYTPLGMVAGQLYMRAIGSGTDGLLRVNPADGASAGYLLPLPGGTPLLDPLIINENLYVGIEVTPSSVAQGRPDIAAYRLLASGGTLLWSLPANGLGLSVIAHDAQTLYLQDGIYSALLAVRLADGAVLWHRGAFGVPPRADAVMGTLFETAPGVVDRCNSSVHQAPRIRASKRANGGMIWTRDLIVAMR